jgi:hypothetical protein
LKEIEAKKEGEPVEEDKEIFDKEGELSDL